MKDLAKQNYSWRQANITVILGVSGFVVVVGRARKDLRNLCEFVSFTLEQVLLPLTLHYEVFEIWSAGENILKLPRQFLLKSKYVCIWEGL